MECQRQDGAEHRPHISTLLFFLNSNYFFKVRDSNLLYFYNYYFIKSFILYRSFINYILWRFLYLNGL